jgi:AraC-like DNA-binding protein
MDVDSIRGEDGDSAETLWVPGILDKLAASVPPGPSLWSRATAEVGVWCCRALRIGDRAARPVESPQKAYVKCPDGMVALMVAIDGTLTVANDTGPPHASILCGLQTRAVEIDVSRATRVLCVYLTPWAAYRLLNRPMHELTDRVVDLAEVAPALPRLLAERLAALSRPWRAVASAARLLAEWVRRGRPYAHEVLGAWRTMHRRGGMVPIGEVANQAGLSERHLETRFREQIGLPPKRYARILRVQRACGLLAGGASVVHTATACGYYDQAHLCREFKTVIGRSPSAFSRSALDLLLVRTGSRPGGAPPGRTTASPGRSPQ